MAVGKKTGGRDFRPGNNYGKGQLLPVELKDQRVLNRIELERILNKCSFMTLEQIKELSSEKNKNSPIFEMIIAKILHKALSGGDLWRAEFILNRLIGRVRDQDPKEIAPPTEREAKPLKSFSDFCEAAKYPRPYLKQLEMVDFIFGNPEPRILLGARGYGKTDYMTVLGTAYDIYKGGSDSTNLIITKSKIRNTAIMEEIAGALKANGIELEKENAHCVRIKGLIGKDHSAEAITIKTSMRGRHPKRILMDDPVTEEDVSKAMRSLVKRKYNEALKLSTNVAVIGQPAHAMDLYAELRNILKKMEVPHGSIPELDHDLNAQRLAGVDETSIKASYFLQISAEESMAFGNIKFCDEMPARDTVAFIDPADGGDTTAITAVCQYLQGIAAEGECFKKPWFQCIEDFIRFMVRNRVRQVYFETNKFGVQPVLQLRQILTPHKIGVIGVHSETNKESIISAAGSMSHLIHLSKKSNKAYTDQVVQYEYGADYDDAPDSLARLLEQLKLLIGKK